MAQFSRGDVLICLCPYSDGSGTKARPVIVIKVSANQQSYLVLECNSYKDKHRSMAGKVIEVNSPEYIQMGLREKSIIVGTRGWLKVTFCFSKIGTCPFISDYPES